MIDYQVPIEKIFKNTVTMNVKVTGVPVWRLRLWIAIKLIKLACRIVWVKMEVS